MRWESASGADGAFQPALPIPTLGDHPLEFSASNKRLQWPQGDSVSRQQPHEGDDLALIKSSESELDPQASSLALDDIDPVNL